MAELTQAQKDALYAEFREQQENDDRIYQAAINENSFRFGGVLTQCDLSQPKPKIDRATNEPILVNGQPQFWDSIYFCELQQLGRSKKFMVSVDLGKDLNVGTSYVFVGENADESHKEKVKLITKLR